MGLPFSIPHVTKAAVGPSGDLARTSYDLDAVLSGSRGIDAERSSSMA